MFSNNIMLPLALTIMFRDYLQKGLIDPKLQKELGPHDDKCSSYNEEGFCEYHKVKCHEKNTFIVTTHPMALVDFEHHQGCEWNYV